MYMKMRGVRRCPVQPAVTLGLAPLSEGRIESDGTLQCSYHGWQFDGRGACTHIPQLRGDAKAMQVACESRRSCVRAFPVQVVHGLLWVRPDSSQQAHEEFAKNPAPPQTAIKELLGEPEVEGFRQTTQWYMRDVPMRFDTLCENILDPSHVPFTHHKVQGNRNNEKGTTTKLVDEISLEGFAFELDFQNPRFGVSVPAFKAPNFVRYGNPIRSLNVFAVPTRPGWSRIYVTFMKVCRPGRAITVGTQGEDTRQPGRLPWLVEKLYSMVEKITWLEHITQRHPVLDGDNYILHLQERALHEEHNSDWQKNFFMPAAADASTIAIRTWFNTFGGAVPTCEPGTPVAPRLTKREALDRYSQHTVHCRHCQKALRNVDLATAVVTAAGILVAGWLAARALMGVPLLSSATGLGLLAAALAGVVVAGLRSLRQQFFFVDYVHAERN
ncbi:hypothetical protein VOLCADRAFT_103059 [Volvox carteri f. nagariensis]|uniref:Rieske domain-containing protein n=1 Tax=Volvox carteri f. nagariensis TaxID=3068 RepID=D8TJN2_VOLCA|nr:uncharacterized protein VOLCADRAFT_103059 [Volvox carteri f. nagariensis]EFJ52402.1 hypothetical protein VOLCADRAFT_103059 [Volvox carteri f. nagariensis]|eukprot:XP_002946475.1 hypothetical protein VOLCADRAFT_103059 [Volvox carteri f. nagariensis]